MKGYVQGRRGGVEFEWPALKRVQGLLLGMRAVEGIR